MVDDIAAAVLACAAVGWLVWRGFFTAPGSFGSWAMFSHIGAWHVRLHDAEELRSHGFRQLTRTAVPWRTVLTSRQFCALLATESRHLALPGPVRRRLLSEVTARLDAEAGGEIRMAYRCLVVGASVG